MEIKKDFTTENGITVTISVNCTVSKMTENEKNKLLSRFAEYSRGIYLEIGEEIDKVNKMP